MAVLRRSEKLRTSNDLLLNKPSGLGGEMGMLANIMLYAFSIMGIDGGSQVCVLENEGRYCLSFPKTSLD